MLMKRLKVVPIELIEKFLQDIDPFNNQKVRYHPLLQLTFLQITFSECVHLLSTEMIRRRDDGQEMAVLEAIAASGGGMASESQSYHNVHQQMHQL